jgi:hypothetical protein
MRRISVVNIITHYTFILAVLVAGNLVKMWWENI